MPPQRYASTEVGALGDTRFTASTRWSLVPFLSLTLERPHGDTTGMVSNGAVGLQVQHWWAGWFVGAHLRYFVELRERPGYSQTRYGPGVGAVIGEEGEADRIWSVQVDLPDSRLSFSANRSAVRAQAGRAGSNRFTYEVYALSLGYALRF